MRTSCRRAAAPQTAPSTVQGYLSDSIIETDSPFLAPEPMRGKKNEPSFVRYTLKKLSELIGKKKILLNMPLFIGNLTASFFQLLPKPLLTKDQLKLLKYDNVLSNKYKTNFDIGVPSKKIFFNEVKKYSYMWRDGGQFSKEKYNSK